MGVLLVKTILNMNTYILQQANIATVFDNYTEKVSSCCSATYNEGLQMCESCGEHCSEVDLTD